MSHHSTQFRIGDVCRFSNGNGFGPADWSDQGLPIIRIQNLNGVQDFNYYSGEPDPSWVVEPGTLLFAWAGVQGVSFGPHIWKGPRGVLNQHIFRVTPTEGLETEWIFLLLEQVTREIERKAHGFKSNLVHVRKEDITERRAYVPSAKERSRILAVHRTLDAQELAIDRLIDAKRRMLDGLAAELLTGRRRLPGFARRPWRAVTIGDLLREENRFVDWNESAEYDLVSVRRWAGGVYTRDRLRGSQIKVKLLKQIKSGDILISHIQSAYGAMALVGGDHDGHYVSDLYMVMVPRDSKACDQRFFGWHCRRPWMWHQAKVSSNGFMAERLRIMFDPVEFLKRPIRIPSDIAEQSAIADVLDAATREMDALVRLREAVANQKRGLMQGLLTEKIRIKEDSHG